MDTLQIAYLKDKWVRNSMKVKSNSSNSSNQSNQSNQSRQSNSSQYKTKPGVIDRRRDW